MLNYTIKSAHITQASPALVDWLLSLNTHNRTLKKTHIEAIKKQINEGNWLLTNQGIGISNQGLLLDGQHRLIAIKELNYPPVEILILTGLDKRAQMVVDNHAKRSARDSIKLFMNRTVTDKLIAMLNFRRQLTKKDNEIGFSSKPADLNDLVDDLVTYEQEISFLEGSGFLKFQAGVAAALFDYSLIYPTKAYNLANQVVAGENLFKNDPAYKLRSALVKNKSGKGGAQLRQLMYLLTVTTCVAHAKNEELKALRPSSSWERLPKPITTIAA